jgi:serine/threonine protein phosphatase PrpC
MAELPTINLSLYAQTDVGMVRSGNEDNFLILDLSTGRSWTASEEEPTELVTYTQGYYGSLLAVSDGMGGALAGEVASRMAVETVRDRMLQLQAHSHYGQMPFAERLRLAIEEANLLIHGDGQTNPAHKGLGATFTAVATHGDQIFFAQVGDSRAYLLRKGVIHRITKDQSLVQQLIDAGQITEEEAETHSYRNVILQALGAHSNVNVEVQELPMRHNDKLLICSDGLSGKMSQDVMAEILNQSEDFPSACQSLIDLANQRGGEDNITVVLAEFSLVGVAEPPPDAVEPQSLARSPDTPTEINWGLGATTDPLAAPPADPGEPPDSQDSKETEPLPSPPAQSTPFTAKLQRNTTDLPKTNDLSDRRGPITAVFFADEIEDEPVEEEPQATTAPLHEPTQARTAPLQARRTEPLAAQKPAPAPTPPPPKTLPEPPRSQNDDKKAGPSQTNLIVLFVLLSLTAIGVIGGVASYIKQKAQARSAQAQLEQKLALENQSQKEGRIELLRGKIAEISKRLQTTERPNLKAKMSVWNESLNQLNQRLDEVGKMPTEQLSQISQACDEINNELKKIEDEVNSLQGLLPSHLTNRQPIKV